MNSASAPISASVVAGGLASRGPHPLDATAWYAVGLAIGGHLGSSTEPVIVGNDGRAAAAMDGDALVRGLLDAGRDVVDLGGLTADGLRFCAGAYGSPAVFVGSSSRYAVDVAVTVWGPGVTPWSEADVAALAELADSVLANGDDAVVGDAVPALGNADAKATGRHTRREVTSEYAAFLTLISGGPCRHPRTVAVDAAGPAVARLLDALVTGDGVAPAWPLRWVGVDRALDDLPDGYADLHRLRESIARERADLGVAFDGDGDQIVVLDERGGVLPPAAVVDLLALPVDRLKVSDGGDYRWAEAWGSVSGLTALLHLLVALDRSDLAGRPLSESRPAYPMKENTLVPELSPEPIATTPSGDEPAGPAVDHGLQPWMRSLLRCPACRAELRDEDGPQGPELACGDPDCGRNYPIVDGIPVLLVDQARVRAEAN